MVCGRLNHAPSWQAVEAERAVLAGLGGGCQLPVGAYATVEGDTLALAAVVVAPDRPVLIHASITGRPGDAERLGRCVADDLLGQGAEGLL